MTSRSRSTAATATRVTSTSSSTTATTASTRFTRAPPGSRRSICWPQGRQADGSGLDCGLMSRTRRSRVRRCGGEVAELAGVVQAAVDRVILATRYAWTAATSRRLSRRRLAYLEAMGHVVVAWLWIEQWLAAEVGAGDLLRRQAPRGPLFRALRAACIGPRLDPVERLDRTALDMREAWF